MMKNNNIDINKQMNIEFILQEDAYIKADSLKHNFYIAKDHKYYDKETKTYKVVKYVSSFPDIDDYLNWFDKQTNKHFYEKLRYEERIEYYDIDGKVGEHDYWNNSKETILDDFFEARKNWIKNTNYNNKIIDPEKDVFLLESRNLNKKKSFHIIIRNGFVFRNIYEQKEFMSSFHKYLKDLDTGLIIDLAPYSKNQVFRTLGSSKIGDLDRVLIRSDYNKNSLTCDRRLFYISYLDPEVDAFCKQSGVSLIDSSKKGIIKYCLNFVTGGKKIEKISVPKDREQNFSENDLIMMFDNLSKKRWDDRGVCISLIWLGIKYGLTEDDIHLFCKKSDKYSEKWVDSVINQYEDDKLKSTIATVKYFLRKDIDKETYDKVVPKDNTYSDIISLPKKDRTKDDKKYLEQVLNKINKRNISLLTDTDGFIERKDDKFVKVDDINDGKIVVVKAGLGKGKTTATVNHINSFSYDCIIILTPRRTYAKSTLTRVKKEIKLPNSEEFVLYSDVKGSIKSKYIIIQVESLCRFTHDFKGENTLVILDEVESLLYQMTSHKTHGANHMENLEMFETLITNSSKVLCMDAFISNKTLNVLKDINCKYKYFNYTKQLEKRTAINLPKKNILKNKLIKDLSEGKKCYFFCSSRKQLTDYFLTDIIRQFPDKKIIEYHSKKVSLDLTTINDQWKEADLIVCTCTITVGCNFDLKDVFNSIFVYASACSRNLVRDIFQSCYRVRHIIDKKLYYCLDTRHNGMNLPTSIDEITKTISDKVSFYKSHYEKFLKMEFTEHTPKWVKNLLITNIHESNMSIMNLEQLFYKYLELCNYDISEEDDEELDDLDIDDEKSNIVFEDYQYEDIPEITFSQRQGLLNKKKTEPLSDIEEFTLNKNFFQATLIVEGRSNINKDDQISLWNVYCNYGKSKFRNLSYEKGLNQGTLRICDIISDSFPELADNLSRKLEDIIDITRKFKLENSQDFKSIEKDTIINNLDWLKENSDRFHSNFGLRNQRKKGSEFTLRQGTDLLSMIFSSWGYSKIKKGKKIRKKVNGRIIDITDYCCENTEEVDVYRYLEGKSRRRYEKKVRIGKKGLPLED